MIYHFNKTTLRQLIHLMRGSRVNLKGFEFNQSQSRVAFDFLNEANLNPGHYQLDILHVTGIELQNKSHLDSDVVQKIVIENDPYQITFENSESDIKLDLALVQVKATKA